MRLLVAPFLLFLALPRVAHAEDEAPPEQPNVEVLPPLTPPSPAIAATPPELVVPLHETRRERRRRLKVRVYDGGVVPPEMHLEKRYMSSQTVPLYVGVPLFGVMYALAATVATQTMPNEPTDGVLLIPVAGPVVRGVESFARIGQSSGSYAGLSDILYFFTGLAGVLDGVGQGAGMGLTIAGVIQMSKGPKLHLVPNERAAVRREPIHFAVRPLAPIGGAHATGLGLTVTGF